MTSPSEPPKSCPCGSQVFYSGPGVPGMHYARHLCVRCGRFAGWQSWPRNQDGQRVGEALQVPQPDQLGLFEEVET
jgi:hypothetical protein